MGRRVSKEEFMRRGGLKNYEERMQGRNTEEGFNRALKPWVDRSSGQHYWEGSTEKQALKTGDNVHRGLETFKTDEDRYRMIREVLRLDVPEHYDSYRRPKNEADKFLEHWKYERNKPEKDQQSKHRAYAVPHAAGKEQMWADLIDLSGHRGRVLNSDLNPEATDLIAVIDGQDRLLDVQNHVQVDGDPRMTISVLKNLAPGLVRQAVASFNQPPTLQKLVDKVKALAGEYKYGDGKLLATGYDRQFNRNPDSNQKNYADQYAMDYLVGGIYKNRPGINLLGAGGIKHGSYDPELPNQMVIADMDKLRSSVLSQTLSELQDKGIYSNTRKDISLQIPVKELQRIAAVDPQKFLSERVLRLIQERKKQ